MLYLALVNVLIIWSHLAEAFKIGIAVSLDTDNSSCDHLNSFLEEVLALERDVIHWRKAPKPYLAIFI